MVKKKLQAQDHEQDIFPNILTMEEANSVRICGKIDEINKFDKFLILNISQHYASHGKVFSNNLAIFVFDFDVQDCILTNFEKYNDINLHCHLQTRSNNGFIELSLIADYVKF